MCAETVRTISSLSSLRGVSAEAAVGMPIHWDVPATYVVGRRGEYHTIGPLLMKGATSFLGRVAARRIAMPSQCVLQYSKTILYLEQG